MNHSTRPMLLGYVRAHLLMAADEIAAARSTLASFAHAEGFVLGTVYIEYAGTAPAALHALMDEIRGDNDVWAVVVPTALHLGNGGRRAMEIQLEQHGSVHVLVADPHP